MDFICKYKGHGKVQAAAPCDRADSDLMLYDSKQIFISILSDHRNRESVYKTGGMDHSFTSFMEIGVRSWEVPNEGRGQIMWYTSHIGANR